MDEIEKQLIEAGDDEKGLKKRALVVDGKTLTFILDLKSNLTIPFLELTRYCSSVLCCRSTPLQKAFLVKVVKEELKMSTLAIGDGANDVSMLQMADVGVGVSGQEGMQAVMASDFAIAKFKILEKLLLIHGYLNYDRLARLIIYFFYKNAVSYTYMPSSSNSLALKFFILFSDFCLCPILVSTLLWILRNCDDGTNVRYDL